MLDDKQFGEITRTLYKSNGVVIQALYVCGMSHLNSIEVTKELNRRGFAICSECQLWHHDVINGLCEDCHTVVLTDGDTVRVIESDLKGKAGTVRSRLSIDRGVNYYRVDVAGVGQKVLADYELARVRHHEDNQ